MLCLQPLLGRDNLLSTLARLLREDGLKSLELATAIAGCFFACSCFKQLHRVLLDNQVTGAAHQGALLAAQRLLIESHNLYMLAVHEHVMLYPFCMLHLC